MIKSSLTPAQQFASPCCMAPPEDISRQPDPIAIPAPVATRVSVIVPARNAGNMIGACLDALWNQTLPAADWELIVVDNGSEDNTREVAREAGARVVSEKRPGVAQARQTGAENACGPLIAFTDADCRPNPDWLERLIAPLEANQEMAFCGGAILSPPPETVAEFYTTHRRVLDQEKFFGEPSPFSFPFFATANAAFQLSALRAVGGFDTALPTTCEDADLCWRLQWAGFSGRYVADAVVFHHHRTDLRALMRQVHRYGRGDAALLRKHRARLEANAGKPLPRLDWRPLGWAMRAAPRVPFAAIFGRDAFERRLPLYDFLCNLALLWGRLRG